MFFVTFGRWANWCLGGMIGTIGTHAFMGGKDLSPRTAG